MNNIKFDKDIDFSYIEPEMFESLALDYIYMVFDEENTAIVPTPYKKDGGKDIVVTHISKITHYKTWIECKNHNRNLGLAEIGKNVVLVISKNINKLIYISASKITDSTQKDILNVGYKNNFEVLFLDGVNFKRELLKYPKLLNKYFELTNTKDIQFTDNIYVNMFLSEFENGMNFMSSSSPIFYLERNNTFFLNFIIGNHADYDIENISLELLDSEEGLHIYAGNSPIQRVNRMSDCNIQLFGVYTGYKTKIKLPNYQMHYKQQGIIKTRIIEGPIISLKHLTRIPLVGKKISEFIVNKCPVIFGLLKKGYSQILLLYGNSGTGKTRLLEEIELLSKKECFTTKYIDSKNKNGSYILKTILSFVLEIPFDNNSIQYTKKDFKNIIEQEYGNAEYVNYLYELFIDNKLNENSIFYLKRALLYFIEYPRFHDVHILFIDNIQECDEFMFDLFTDLFNSMHSYSAPFMFVLSSNIEVESLSGDANKKLISYICDMENSIPSYCYSFCVEDLDESDAKIFLSNLFIKLEYEDPIIEQFIEKSGTRPFEMLMLFKYLTENGIFLIDENLSIPSIAKYKDFMMCVPPQIDALIKARIQSIKKNISLEQWIECENIIKSILLFYNKIPSIFLDLTLKHSLAKNILIDSLIIKYRKHSNDLEFYHDNIYRFFMKKAEYQDLGELGIPILEWLLTHPDYEIENREKIIFYCYLKTGQRDKAVSIGIKLIYKYFNAFDFKSTYEICSHLYNLEYIKNDKVLYFKVCYMYAMSSWETVDIYKTLDIYNEIHSFINLVIDYIPIGEICKYYREYINANSHAGLYLQIKPLLEEFEQLPNLSKEYLFVLHNRYTVYYMRMNNFYLAKEHSEQAYHIAETLNDNFLKSTACSDIAFNYLYNKKDYVNAVKYFKKAIEYYREEDDHTYYRQLEIYNQKAIILLIEKDFIKSIDYLDKSINKSHQLQNKYMEAKALNYKAIVECHADNYDFAFKSWMEAIRITEKLGNYSMLICIYFNLSSSYLLQNDYNKAYEAIKKAFTILEDTNNPIRWSENFDVLFHNYLVCCLFLKLNEDIVLILKKYPQYNEFYKTLQKITDIKYFLCDHSMNYYGKDGFSFL